MGRYDITHWMVCIRLYQERGSRCEVGTWWNRIQSHSSLVRILQQHIFAVFLVEHQFTQHFDNTPHVVDAQIDLGSKVFGFEELGGEDHVFVRVAGSDTRDVSKLHLVRTWRNKEGGYSRVMMTM